MAKPALGRGLEHLMKGDAVRQPGKSEGQQPQLSKGFQTLTRQEAAEAQVPAPRKPILPAWFFFAADLLLLGFTVAILFNGSKPLDWRDWIFCIVTTGVAGLFGTVGVLISANQRGETKEKEKAGDICNGGHHNA